MDLDADRTLAEYLDGQDWKILPDPEDVSTPF